MAIVVDKDKKENILKLIKSFKELDTMMQPLQEQKKDLRNYYVKEKEFLTNDEYSLVKKAYNNRKKNVDMDDLAVIAEVVKEEMPSS